MTSSNTNYPIDTEEELRWWNAMTYAGYAFVLFCATAFINGVARGMMGETCK